MSFDMRLNALKNSFHYIYVFLIVGPGPFRLDLIYYFKADFIMYLQKKYFAGLTLDVEKYHTTKFNSKKITRSANINRTPENMKKVNERNAAKNLRRKINANFTAGDYHLILTYRPEERALNPEDARNDLKRFLDRMRRHYKKLEKELKYIAVAEYGKVSMHFHMVVNGGVLPEEINKIWGHGRVGLRVLDDSGDYIKLADYLIKQTRKTYNDPEKAVFKKRWCSSRNLKEPEVETNIVKADSWREYPKAPKGYMIIPDSIEYGVSEITGYPYQYYRMIKIPDKKQKEKKRYVKNNIRHPAQC